MEASFKTNTLPHVGKLKMPLIMVGREAEGR